MSWFKKASGHEEQFWHHVSQIVNQKDISMKDALRQLSVWGYDEHSLREMLKTKGIKDDSNPIDDVMKIDNTLT